MLELPTPAAKKLSARSQREAPYGKKQFSMEPDEPLATEGLRGDLWALFRPEDLKKLEVNWANRTIWTGDNLSVMRGMNSESVDLIYLDPPFNSNRDYAAPIGSKAAGAAFKDTWTLDDVDLAWHGEIAEQNPAVYAVIDAAGISHGFRHEIVLDHDGCAALGNAAALEAHGEPVSPLRPDGKRLPQTIARCRVRFRELPQRDRVEANE